LLARCPAQQWFRDCKPLVGDVVRKTLERLLQLGATRVDVSLPDLDLVQAGHIATWAKEQEADGDAAGWLKDWSLRTQVGGCRGVSRSCWWLFGMAAAEARGMCLRSTAACACRPLDNLPLPALSWLSGACS
jgi:hypothetical protein